MTLPQQEIMVLLRMPTEQKIKLGADPNTPIPVLLELGKLLPTLVAENPALELAPLEDPAHFPQVIEIKRYAQRDWISAAVSELQKDFAEQGFQWHARIPMLLAASRLQQLANAFPRTVVNARLAKPLLDKMLRLNTPMRDLNPDHNGFFFTALRDHTRRDPFSRILLRGVRCLNVYREELSTQFRADWDLTRVKPLPDPLHFASHNQMFAALGYSYIIELRNLAAGASDTLPLLAADTKRALNLVRLVKDKGVLDLRKLLAAFNTPRAKDELI